MGLRGTGNKQTAGTTPSPEATNACRCSTAKVSEFAGRTTRKPREWRVLGSKSRTSEVHRYCCKYDDLDVNPVAGYEKPSATPRVTSFTPEEEKLMYETADDAQALFIKACILTGARPYSELAKVTADHVVETEQGMFYLLKARTADGRQGHKSGKKTGKDRRIMLCEEMETITGQ